MIPKSHTLHAEAAYQDETLKTGKQASLALWVPTCAQCSAEILSSLSGVGMNLSGSHFGGLQLAGISCELLIEFQNVQLHCLTGLELNILSI